MKILLINTYDTGGAAKACIRLHLGLLERGIDSNLLLLAKIEKEFIPKCTVFSQTRDMKPFFCRLKNKTKIILKKINLYYGLDDNKYLKNRPDTSEIFSLPFSPFFIKQHKLFKDADIINLHWVAGFLDYNNFFAKNDKKIIWTLHDMFPFTGGCHYSNSCNGFKTKCKNCPQLSGTVDDNYSKYLLNIKYRAIKNFSKLNIVTPSKWLSKESSSSKIFSNFRHNVIPNGTNTRIFRIYDKKLSRQAFNLPLNKRIILFVADVLGARRKGFSYLIRFLEKLSESAETVVCAVGSINKKLEIKNLISLGKITKEEDMGKIYSASDLFVIPSLEDNLPNTAIESLLCGTPIVGFPVGGIKDIVMNNVNGYLCNGISVNSLVTTINKFFIDAPRFNRNKIREEALKKYDINVSVDKYINLYQEIFNN